MLDGIHLGGVELDVQSLHHVAGDGAGKQTADELGHLDHGDVVQDAVDGHARAHSSSTIPNIETMRLLFSSLILPSTADSGLSLGSDFRPWRLMRKAATGPPMREPLHCPECRR